MQNTQRYVRMGLATTLIVALGSVVVGTQVVQAQIAELVIELHEDLSITLTTMNGTEIKGFANVEALGGANGLVDMVEQMGEWIN